MKPHTESSGVASMSSRLTLSFASTQEEILEVQRLRYRVFIESGGLDGLSNHEGLDRDEFDAHCEHLIVRDSSNLKVVGTYRILGPAAARRIGRFYSEGEFDLQRLSPLRGRMAEAGRACIDPEYRTGAVIMLLWAGLAAYMRREQCEYLVGCASIGLADGGANAMAVCRELMHTHLAPVEYRVTPHLRFVAGEEQKHGGIQVPPLLKGYLRSGAWICGEPAWDSAFDCVDLFLMLPLANLDGRYARRYLSEKGEQVS